MPTDTRSPEPISFTAAQSTIDGVLTLSPAEHVRRPNVPRESPTLGLTHLQFEAILTTARLSTNRNDFALVAMLGLLGLRIFEACGADISDLGEDHGHRVLRVTGKGAKVVVLTPPTSCGPNHRPRHRRKNCGPLADQAGVRLPRMHPHMMRHTVVTTMLDAAVDLRDVQIAARHADPPTTMRYDRARKNLDRPGTSTWPPAGTFHGHGQPRRVATEAASLPDDRSTLGV